MTTPWMVWSVIDSLVDACELMKVMLDNTTPKIKDEIRTLLIITKTMQVRAQNDLISITHNFIKLYVRLVLFDVPESVLNMFNRLTKLM
ncbi:MAG TPA: hypothetical protein VJ599_03035 [Nitrososphaeraceae archaeon]|nr:hypothetical protein [Nitrososphaeraceae archaeon]